MKKLMFQVYIAVLLLSITLSRDFFHKSTKLKYLWTSFVSTKKEVITIVPEGKKLIIGKKYFKDNPKSNLLVDGQKNCLKTGCEILSKVNSTVCECGSKFFKLMDKPIKSMINKYENLQKIDYEKFKQHFIWSSKNGSKDENMCYSNLKDNFFSFLTK